MTKFLSLITVAVALVASSLNAQNARGEEEVPTRDLSVTYVFSPRTPNVFYRDKEGEYRELRIGRYKFGPKQEIVAGENLTLYSKGRDPETGKELMVPRRTYALPAGQEPVKLLFYFDGEGNTDSVMIPHSSSAHPALTVRVVNLLQNTAAVRIGEDGVVVPPGGADLIKPNVANRERFYVQYAIRRGDQPDFVSGKKRIRFIRPNQRLTLVLGYKPVYDTGENTNNPEAEGQTTLSRYQPADLLFFDLIEDSPSSTSVN